MSKPTIAFGEDEWPVSVTADVALNPARQGEPERTVQVSRSSSFRSEGGGSVARGASLAKMRL